MDLGRWEQNSKSSPAGVHSGPGLTRLQFQVEVEQHETQELFDLIDGEVAAGTHGRTGAERHQVIFQPLAALKEAPFAVLDVTVELERLSGEERRLMTRKHERSLMGSGVC